MLTCSLLLVSIVFCGWQRSRRGLALSCVLLCLTSGSANTAAQTVQFDGAQRPVATGFYEPEGVAVDRFGNLFVADADTFLISEILAVNGQIPANPTVRNLYRDSSNPEKIAVDRAGNVYFTDSDTSSNLRNNTVKEILAVNGSIPASPTVIQLGSGLFYPRGLAIDTLGDVFIADTDNNAIKEFVAVNGAVPPSPAIITLGGVFTSPQAVAVDSAGNVYVADQGNHAVKEIVAVNGSIPAFPTILTLASGYCSPDGLSLDPQGNLYFSDYCNAAIYEILAVNGAIPSSPFVKTISTGAGLSGVTDVAVDVNENIYAGGVFAVTQIPQVYPSDFGSVRVGATSGITPLMFTLDGSVTIGSISIVGTDFANAGNGTCAPGTSPYYYTLCTVNVTFTPSISGARSGAVILMDASGNALGTGYVHGVGVAPLVNFAPPVQSAALSNIAAPGGIAIDSSGNIYIAATGQNQILKETRSGGSYTQSLIPTSTLNAPRAVAVDGAGNIYIADTGNNRVLRETPSASGFKETTVDTMQAPVGVAVDQDGHFDIVYAGGVFTGFRIDGYLGTGLSSASGLAVDTSDNLYIVSNSTPGSILKLTLNGSNYLSSTIPLAGFVTPSGISLDEFGNIFVSGIDSNGVGQVVKLTPSSSGYTQSTISTQSLNQPTGITLDANGNLFIADSGNGSIVKIDSSDPPTLSFTTTPVGSTSGDSPQTITVANTGNAGLIIPIPATGSNPSIPTNFTLDENAPSACPSVSSGSPIIGVIAAGASCVLPISFAPATVANTAGSAVLTDNNLNASAPAYASQAIPLTGTAVPGTPVITWPTPAAITYGTALSAAQLDATANVPGTFSYSPAAGSVLASGTLTLHVTFTPTDSTDYTTATSSALLTVNKATPVITWPAPAPIASGTPLSSTQLNATANVPGTFAYSPAAGTILPVGSNTLNVTLTPTDTADYTTAGASVMLVVNAPNFTLAVSPNALAVKQGGKASSAVAIASTGGFTGNVTLSASGLPKGVTAAFSTNPTQTGSAITFTATNGATLGTSVITITGKSGALSQTTSIALTVAHK